ncbi:MAG TPA: hypothetical protein VF691_08590 [Cytophagaceae bacterium]
MSKKLPLFFFTFLYIANFCISQRSQQNIDYVSKVNTLIGSNNNFLLSHGNTLPLVTRPFGMTTWCAQTAKGGNWMYNYNDTVIHAFRATHQPSPWMGDYATFNLMPSNGRPESNVSKRSSKYSHQNEKAFPHYYEVDLLSRKDQGRDDGYRKVRIPRIYLSKVNKFIGLFGCCKRRGGIENISEIK